MTSVYQKDLKTLEKVNLKQKKLNFDKKRLKLTFKHPFSHCLKGSINCLIKISSFIYTEEEEEEEIHVYKC